MECTNTTSQNQQISLMFPTSPKVVNEAIMVHDIFNTVLIELNQMKAEDKILNDSITVLPSLFWLFETIVGRFIEDDPRMKEVKIKGISRCLAASIKGIIPWSEFVKYADEP